MEKHEEFMGLVLDDGVLHTPSGPMDLDDLTRAEFVREVVAAGHGPSTQGYSPQATAGGAVVGGVLFGGAGAVVGGLLGSTAKQEVPGAPEYRTASVQLVFETGSSDFSMDIPRDKEADAHAFAQSVEKAMKRHKKMR
ncbi:MAG: hypothetical protein PF636_11340 [Actinomycetota bacterium]|jgi:hypothetical protein|nr:hypothetical protein [Actinomycetota bacterium]